MAEGKWLGQPVGAAEEATLGSTVTDNDDVRVGIPLGVTLSAVKGKSLGRVEGSTEGE